MTTRGKRFAEIHGHFLTLLAEALQHMTLTNCILSKAGFHLIINHEAQSDYTSPLAAHVRYMIVDELVVDGTPDFTGRIRPLRYMRSSSAVIDIFIGECESAGSRYPMAQLALNTLGALLKHDRQEVADNNRARS